MDQGLGVSKVLIKVSGLWAFTRGQYVAVLGKLKDRVWDKWHYLNESKSMQQLKDINTNVCVSILCPTLYSWILRLDSSSWSCRSRTISLYLPQRCSTNAICCRDSWINRTEAVVTTKQTWDSAVSNQVELPKASAVLSTEFKTVRIKIHMDLTSTHLQIFEVV